MTAAFGDVIRVDLLGTQQNEDIVNSLQFRVGNIGGVPDADLVDDMLEILEALAAIIAAISTALTVWDRIRVHNLTQDVVFGFFDFSSPVSGTATGDAGPRQSTLALSFPTAVPKVILRKFFGPVAEANLGANGQIVGNAVTAGLAVLDMLLDDITVTNGVYRYGYLSPVAGGFVVPVSGTFLIQPGALGRRRLGAGS